MRTSRAIATAGVAAAAIAAAAGVAVAAGGAGNGSGVDDTVSTLVEEGTVSSADAEAFSRVHEQLQAERQERRAEREARHEEMLAEIAAAAGVSTDELQERLGAGESLSDIAGDNADAVAELLTQQANKRLAQAEASIDERVDAMMEREGFGQRGFGGGPGGHGMGRGSGPGMGEGLGAGAGFGANSETSSA